MTDEELIQTSIDLLGDKDKAYSWWMCGDGLLSGLSPYQFRKVFGTQSRNHILAALNQRHGGRKDGRTA